MLLPVEVAYVLGMAASVPLYTVDVPVVGKPVQSEGTSAAGTPALMVSVTAPAMDGDESTNELLYKCRLPDNVPVLLTVTHAKPVSPGRMLPAPKAPVVLTP